MPKAKNLKTLRQSHHLTQEKLADALSVSKSTILSWENKKHAIPEPSARRIAEFFDVSYDDFCDTDFEKLEKEYHDPLTLTEIERQNIALFRELPNEIKNAIRKIIIQTHKMMKEEQT